MGQSALIVEILNEPITEKELRGCLKQMEVWKATGSDRTHPATEKPVAEISAKTHSAFMHYWMTGDALLTG